MGFMAVIKCLSVLNCFFELLSYMCVSFTELVIKHLTDFNEIRRLFESV